MEQWAGTDAGHLHADWRISRRLESLYDPSPQHFACYLMSLHCEFSPIADFASVVERHMDFLIRKLILSWVGKKWGENKYISALMKSSLDCAVWVLWIRPPLTGCMEGMKIGVAVLQEKAV